MGLGHSDLLPSPPTLERGVVVEVEVVLAREALALERHKILVRYVMDAAHRARVNRFVHKVGIVAALLENARLAGKGLLHEEGGTRDEGAVLAPDARVLVHVCKARERGGTVLVNLQRQVRGHLGVGFHWTRAKAAVLVAVKPGSHNLVQHLVALGV